MTSRDLERLVRTFLAQKLDKDYIKHYLMETYQLDLKTAEEIIAKVAGGGHGGGKTGTESIKPPPRRQKFF